MENASGETSVLGVTAEHPLYDAAVGWTQAGELVAGDVVLDAMLEPLTVLALQVDDTPQLVHNLEIGGAHTYFAGEMAAWAHNSQGGVYLNLYGSVSQYFGRSARKTPCPRQAESVQEKLSDFGSPSGQFKWNSSDPLEAAIWERMLIRDATGANCPLANIDRKPAIPNWILDIWGKYH